MSITTNFKKNGVDIASLIQSLPAGETHVLGRDPVSAMEAATKQYVDAHSAVPVSAALTGTPTAPTATVGTNTTQIATTAFVLANSAPPVINTYAFNIQYSGSNPASVTGLPSGWSVAFNDGGSPSKIRVTHTTGKALQNVAYWGSDASVSGQTMRLPTSTYKASVPTAAATTQFVLDMPSTATSTDSGGVCRVVVSF
jgi:hypothetical protein